MAGRSQCRRVAPPLPERRSIPRALTVILLLVGPSALAAAAVPVAMLGGPTLAPHGSTAPALPIVMAGPAVSTLTVQLTLTPSVLAENTPLGVSVQISPPWGSPWALAWSGLPSSCSSSAPTSTSTNPLSWNCQPTVPGNYTVHLQVTNTTSATNSTSAQVTVYAPLSATFSFTPSPALVGSLLTTTYQVSGGVRPYTLQWGTPLPSGCTGAGPPTVPDNAVHTWTCTPSQVFNSQVTLQVTDNASPTNAHTTSQQLTVDAPALQVSLTVNPPTVGVNTQVTFGYRVTGGVSPYQLQWHGLPNSCTGAAPGSVSDNRMHNWTCSPSQSGNTQVSVQVTDSNGSPGATMTSSNQPLNVNPSSGNGNGNGNGNKGSNGNGSNNSFQLPSFFSNLGSILLIALIMGLVGFILLIIIAVSTLATAVLVARRLPARSRTEEKEPTVPCPSCGAASPTKAKFCPECGKTMTPPKSPA